MKRNVRHLNNSCRNEAHNSNIYVVVCVALGTWHPCSSSSLLLICPRRANISTRLEKLYPCHTLYIKGRSCWFSSEAHCKSWGLKDSHQEKVYLQVFNCLASDLSKCHLERSKTSIKWYFERSGAHISGYLVDGSVLLNTPLGSTQRIALMLASVEKSATPPFNTIRSNIPGNKTIFFD